MVENHWFKRISGGQGSSYTVDREFPPHFYKYYLQIKQIVKLQVLLFSDSWVHIRMQVSLGLEDFQLWRVS